MSNVSFGDFSIRLKKYQQLQKNKQSVQGNEAAGQNISMPKADMNSSIFSNQNTIQSSNNISSTKTSFGKLNSQPNKTGAVNQMHQPNQVYLVKQ
jgi:hypothetical protein